MPLQNYGLLKGKAIAAVPGDGGDGHYHVHVVANDISYRVAIKVISESPPSDLLCRIDPNFCHPITDELTEVEPGLHPLPSRPDGLALDFIRGNLFEPERLLPLPFDCGGRGHDLNREFDLQFGHAIAEPLASVYAFGQHWGPEPNRADRIFGFRPANGLHDVHMNQANAGKFVRDDGAWQDGAVMIEFPTLDRWVAIFLKFQSQGWHSDDIHGHATDAATLAVPRHALSVPDGMVRIVAASMGGRGADRALPTVTLLNTLDEQLDLSGWALADRGKNRQRLHGRVGPGESVRVPLEPPVQISRKGGVLTLVNERQMKVNGVAYTRRDFRKRRGSLVFRQY